MSTPTRSHPPQSAIPASGPAITPQAEVAKLLNEMSPDLREIQIYSPFLNAVLDGALKWNGKLDLPEQVEFLKKLRIYLNYLLLLTPETRDALGASFDRKTLNYDPCLCFDVIKQEVLSIGDNKKMNAICQGSI